MAADGLEPGCEPRLARAVVVMILAVEMGEHDFVGEERGPFKGGGAVGVGSAQKLVLAVGEFYQLGLAELLDHLLATALGYQIF